MIINKLTTRRNKRILLLCLLFSPLCLLTSTYCLAVDFAGSLKGVSITDAASTNTPPVASFIYIVESNTVTFDASGSKDSDGTITEYKWDFGDGNTGIGTTVSHQYMDTTDRAVTLTLIDNANAITILQESVILQQPIDISINFQPANAEVAAGYQVDSGESYSDALGYGWTVPSYEIFVDRNAATAPDQTYDTVVNVYSDAIWEAAVPEGTYTVSVLVGDPTYPYAVNSVQLEGIDFIKAETTSLNEPFFIERTGTVPVTDGKLTMTFTGSKPKAKLCRIIISTQ